jgi:hypothetical protein
MEAVARNDFGKGKQQRKYVKGRKKRHQNERGGPDKTESEGETRRLAGL